MAPGHERLDVYRLAIGYIAWVCVKATALEGIHRAARDPWLRASLSITLTGWKRLSGPGRDNGLRRETNRSR